MNKYNLVFDASALISENFPEISSSFRQLIEIADLLKINLYIPEIVVKELEQKFIDDTETSINKIEREHKKLKKIVQDKFDLSVPKLRDIQVAYTEKVQYLIESHKLIIIPIPSINAVELIDRAVKRIPPFEGEDKGFRDAMIIESVIEYGVSNTIQSFVFIAFDKIFENGAIAEAAKSKGIDFRLEKSISDVNKELFDLLGTLQQEAIKEQEKRALALLKTKNDEINEYLRTNFEIADYEIVGLHGIPLRLVDIELVNIESAVLEEKEDNRRGISFVAEVSITMLVRSFGLGFGVPRIRKFKIGEGESTEIDTKQLINDLLKAPSRSPLMQLVEEKHTIKVIGEIEVELVGGEYRDFRIIYIRSQPQTSLATWLAAGLNYSD